jgi:metal-dependent amidase/aminoacylase/carboxypeptidase family protein
MLPYLNKTLGENNVVFVPPSLATEDFSFYALKVPGLFLWLGGMPKGTDPDKASPLHTPNFVFDDSGLKTGVSVLVTLVLDYMGMK